MEQVSKILVCKTLFAFEFDSFIMISGSRMHLTTVLSPVFDNRISWRKAVI